MKKIIILMILFFAVSANTTEYQFWGDMNVNDNDLIDVNAASIDTLQAAFSGLHLNFNDYNITNLNKIDADSIFENGTQYSFADYLKKNGTIALTANWDAGDFDVTGLNKVDADSIEGFVSWLPAGNLNMGNYSLSTDESFKTDNMYSVSSAPFTIQITDGYDFKLVSSDKTTMFLIEDVATNDNYVTINNSDDTLKIYAAGTDSDIPFKLIPKGTGKLYYGDNEIAYSGIALFQADAIATNEIRPASGSTVYVQDSTSTYNIVAFDNDATAGSENTLVFHNSDTANYPEIEVTGGASNSHLSLRAKGSGDIMIGTTIGTATLIANPIGIFNDLYIGGDSTGVVKARRTGGSYSEVVTITGTQNLAGKTFSSVGGFTAATDLDIGAYELRADTLKAEQLYVDDITAIGATVNIGDASTPVRTYDTGSSAFKTILNQYNAIQTHNKQFSVINEYPNDYCTWYDSTDEMVFSWMFGGSWTIDDTLFMIPPSVGASRDTIQVMGVESHIDTDDTFASASDVLVASQLATKTYVDAYVDAKFPIREWHNIELASTTLKHDGTALTTVSSPPIKVSEYYGPAEVAWSTSEDDSTYAIVFSFRVPENAADDSLFLRLNGWNSAVGSSYYSVRMYQHDFGSAGVGGSWDITPYENDTIIINNGANPDNAILTLSSLTGIAGDIFHIKLWKNDTGSAITGSLTSFSWSVNIE